MALAETDLLPDWMKKTAGVPAALSGEHVHYFRLLISGPDCDECQYSAIIGTAKCRCGEEIGSTEIEKRINA